MLRASQAVPAVRVSSSRGRPATGKHITVSRPPHAALRRAEEERGAEGACAADLARDAGRAAHRCRPARVARSAWARRTRRPRWWIWRSAAALSADVPAALAAARSAVAARTAPDPVNSHRAPGLHRAGCIHRISYGRDDDRRPGGDACSADVRQRRLTPSGEPGHDQLLVGLVLAGRISKQAAIACRRSRMLDRCAMVVRVARRAVVPDEVDEVLRASVGWISLGNLCCGLPGSMSSGSAAFAGSTFRSASCCVPTRTGEA